MKPLIWLMFRSEMRVSTWRMVSRVAMGAIVPTGTVNVTRSLQLTVSPGQN
jgi:hypothetical protein